MNPTTYIPIIMMWVILFITFSNQRRSRQIALTRRIINNRKKGGATEMIELAKRFIGKECLIYAFDSSHQFEGVIKEVTDGAILIEKGSQTEAINLDFVIRIREYPRDKKGKKKSVIID